MCKKMSGLSTEILLLTDGIEKYGLFKQCDVCGYDNSFKSNCKRHYGHMKWRSMPCKCVCESIPNLFPGCTKEQYTVLTRRKVVYDYVLDRNPCGAVFLYSNGGYGTDPVLVEEAKKYIG